MVRGDTAPEGNEVAKREAKAYEVHGHKLVCPICGHDAFWTRRTLLNTPMATFLNFDWANRQATNFVCEECGHILWFAPRKNR